MRKGINMMEDEATTTRKKKRVGRRRMEELGVRESARQAGSLCCSHQLKGL